MRKRAFVFLFCFGIFLFALITFREAVIGSISEEDINYLKSSAKDVEARFYELIKIKGLNNITAQDVMQIMDERTLNILKKYYFDNGCPFEASSFEECIEKAVSDIKRLFITFGLTEKLLSEIDKGKEPPHFICPINLNIKDEETCYREAAKQLAMLPILSLMRDKELKEKNWLYAPTIFKRPRIFPKEIPSTEPLAIEGVSCALTNGNLMTVSNFNAHFINVAFGKGVPYSIQSWFGTDMVDTGGPGCDPTQGDCGFEQNINTATGEFYGFFQWLADQIEESLAGANVIQMIQGLLVGQGTCSSMAGVTMCLVVKDHTSWNGNQCYEDTCGGCNPVNDNNVMYFNRGFVEVFPDPTAGYLTAIIALWSETDSANIDPYPNPLIPAHNTIDSGNSRPTSEICFEARSCADGWTFGHGDTQFRAYTEGVLLRVRLQVVVQGSLVDVCAASVDLDILGSDVDHPVLGCLTDCTNTEALLEGLGPTLEGAIDSFLHGDCPIPGTLDKTDADLSLCPKKPKGMPGTGPGGGNCGALLPPCPTYSATWGCCWDYSTGSMKCQTGGGGGGCKHALLPIDLNEFLITGRAFSVSQYCRRPTSADDPPSGHAHEDPRKCYPGPVVAGTFSKLKEPWYGTLGCFSGEYDIGCYTQPSRMILTGTGCSISFDAGIKPKDLSDTCYPGFMTRGLALATGTSGFFPRPAFSINNYSPFPYPDNALLTTRINSWVLTSLAPTNWDNGYAQSGIGFPFWFYGSSYSDMCISTNGYITLPQGNTGECTDPTPDPIPSTNPPDPYIAPLWADLSGDGNEFLYYFITLPPLFVPRTQQARQPGAWWTGNNNPQVAIGWSGVSSYYHLPTNQLEGNICRNDTNFNNYVYAYPLPFNFPFYGSLNNYLCIDSNGWVALRSGGCGGVGSDATPDPIPNGATPNGIIAALWKDLDPAHQELRGGGDCDGRCPECEGGCVGACTTTSDSISWFCHQPGDQSCNPGWTYCSGGCANCGGLRWCKDFDSVYNGASCCPAGQDCSGACDANNNCTGTCYNAPGCRPPFDANCRRGPCDGDECGCNQRTEHCHGSCILGVCTNCDTRCDSTGGAGGCGVQDQCCFSRGGGTECACASNQTCQGGCEADANFLDPEPQQRLFRVLGAGYVFLGSIDKDGNGVPDPVDCPGADLADGVFDDDNDGNYYDDDSGAPNCQAIVITWYKIPDYDAINDNGCGNDDNNDCPGTDEDCCSSDICSGGVCQNCGACNSDNRALCALRAKGVLNPEPSYNPGAGAGPCDNKNTVQVVLFSDGTIDINLESWTNTNILIDPDGPGGSGCGPCGLCLTGCDCDPKTNPRPHHVGIENFTGTQGIEVPNPRPQVTYRFIPVGRASDVCGPASIQVGTFGNCPDTLNPSINRTCRVIRWRNFHVKGQAICTDMYALLYNVGTGIFPASNYDIVFYMKRFWSPIPGVPDPAAQSRIARQSNFTRVVGVENAAGNLGQYGYIPPDGTGIVMRYSPPFLYFIGAGVSQDLLSDAAQMFYSSGLLCLAVNPGGVYTTDANKYNDVSAFLPFNLSNLENLAYFFNSVRYICDPDSPAEIRLYPTGLSPASARTGTAWPSLLTPPAPSGGPFPAFPSGFPAQPYSDFTFLLPNYAASFYCRRNNLGVGNPANFRKDGNPGGPAVELFRGLGDWFLAADIEYLVKDVSPGWPPRTPSPVTTALELFIDVKPQVSQITWNPSVPMSGRIGGISDILGDVLSGYLQAMLRTRLSFPIDITNVLHPLIKYIKPEGPDVTLDEFPNTTSWQVIETKFPWVVTMPDYVAAYIGCVDWDGNSVIDPIVECRDYSILGALDLNTLLNAFGGGFLAPPLNGHRRIQEFPQVSPPPFEVIIGDKRCKGGEVCYLDYETAKRYLGDIQNYVQVVYGGLKKIAIGRNGAWRIPIPLRDFSGVVRINVGPWLDGENELSFYAIDERDVGWQDIAKVKFTLDRLEPVLWVKGGNGEFDEKLKMRVFHSDRKQVLILGKSDNISSPSDIEISYSVGYGDNGKGSTSWSEWEKGDRIELSLPRGIYRLSIRAKDKAGNISEFSELIYVKGDEVMGCPVIGSITEENIKVMFGFVNALIPISVILFAIYLMKSVRNGKNGGNGN